MRLKSRLHRKEPNMKMKQLPKDADSLLALAEGIATVLEQRRNDLGISADIEALLRASIAAAQLAIDTYLAILSGAGKSPVAMSFLKEAQTQCDRKIEQLRRRVNRAIVQLSRLRGGKDLANAARKALSACA